MTHTQIRQTIINILVFFLCTFGFFSAIKLRISVIFVICLLSIFLLLLLNQSKIIISPLFFLWFFDVILILIYVVAHPTSYHIFDLYFFILICTSMVVTSCKKVNVKSALKIIISLSICSIAAIILEMTVRNVFFTVFSPILSGENLLNERMRTQLGKGFRGLSEFPNVISIAAAAILYYSVWEVDTRHRAKRIILFVISLFGIIASGERSNILLIPASATAVYALFEGKDKAMRIIKVVGILFALATAFVIFRRYLYGIRLFQRFYNTLDLLIAGEDYLSGRGNLRKVVISLWKRHLFVGNGWFYFFYNNQGILAQDTYSHAHNFYLEILCDCGLIGLFLTLIPMTYSVIINIKSIYTSSNELAPILKITLAMQIFFLTDSMFHVTFYNLNMLGLYFVFIMLMILASSKENISYTGGI